MIQKEKGRNIVQNPIRRAIYSSSTDRHTRRLFSLRSMYIPKSRTLLCIILEPSRPELLARGEEYLRGDIPTTRPLTTVNLSRSPKRQPNTRSSEQCTGGTIINTSIKVDLRSYTRETHQHP